MGTYLKPLRRKIGVTLLLLACVLTAGWVRSLTVYDSVEIGIGKFLFEISSIKSRIGYGQCQVHQGGVERSFFRIDTISITADNFVIFDPEEASDWNFVAGDFYIHAGKSQFANTALNPIPGSPPVPGYSIQAQVPFWSIVVPLTVLSAWRLFSKPRQSPAKV